MVVVAGAVSCLLCQFVVHELAGFASNATAVAEVIASLQSDCDDAFPLNKTLDKACRALAEAAVDVLPFAQKQLSMLAWDERAVCAALGSCEVDCCQSDVPEQVHLALRQSPNEMAVMWTTRPGATGQVVLWGTSPESLTESSVERPPRTYTHFGWRGSLHTAIIDELKPGTEYYYRVGDGASGGLMSNVWSFRTLPAGVGNESSPLRVASLGDMGYGPLSDATIASLGRLVDRGELDLVMHAGDISYADGDMMHWDVFMRKIEPIAARVPYMTAPGNHEFWFNFTAYRYRFAMPDDGAHDGMYWSLYLGQRAAEGAAVPSGVHLSSIDTESPLDFAWIDDRQRAWLAAELAEARPAAWRLVAGHRPLYCTNHAGQDVPHGNGVLRAKIESVLLEAKVDLVLQAHEHDYERSWPTVNGLPTQANYTAARAPVYVVNGAAGNREKNELPPGDQPWSASVAPGSALCPQTANLSFGLLEIRSWAGGGGRLVYRQIDSRSGGRLDEFTILK